jgi:hydrogenase maturation protein HypF
MELEALVAAPRALLHGYAIADGVLDFTPLLAALAERRLMAQAGADVLHGTLIAGVGEWIAQAANDGSHRDVALGGGCMMNRVLAEGIAQDLRGRGLQPFFPRAVPANDGGLSLGQAQMLRAALAAGAALEET